MIAWTEEHPKLAKVLTLVAAGVGALLLVFGAILLALPLLISGFTAMGVAITIATGPVGIIIVAVAALVAGAILLWKNWDFVWDNMKKVTETAVNFIIGLFNKMTFVYRQALAGMIVAAKAVVGLIPGMGKIGDAMQVAIDMIRAGAPMVDMTAEKFKALGDQATETAGEVVAGSNEQATAIEDMSGRIKTSLLGVGDAAEAGADKVGGAVASIRERIAEWVTDNKDAMGRIEKLGGRFLASFKMVMAGRIGAEKAAAAVIEREGQRIADLQSQWADDRSQQLRDMIDRGAAAAAAVENQARRQEGALATVRSSWDRVRDNLDPVLEKFKDLGVNATSIVQRWSDSTGQSVDSIIGKLAGLGVHSANTKDVMKAFAQEIGIAWESLVDIFGRVKKAASEVPSTNVFTKITSDPNIDRLKATIATLSGAPDFATNPTQQTLARAARSSLRALGVEGYARGGVVPGPSGQPQLAMVHGGEKILPPGRGAGMTVNLVINGDINGMDDFEQKVTSVIRDAVLGGGFSGVLARA